MLKALEEQVTCRSGVLTHNGSKSLDMKLITSAQLMQEEENVLKFNMVKMLRLNQLCTLTEMTRSNRDGTLFMLTKLKKNKQRDLPKTGDSISTDHSISDLDSQ